MGGWGVAEGQAAAEASQLAGMPLSVSPRPHACLSSPHLRRFPELHDLDADLWEPPLHLALQEQQYEAAEA